MTKPIKVKISPRKLAVLLVLILILILGIILFFHHKTSKTVTYTNKQAGSDISLNENKSAGNISINNGSPNQEGLAVIGSGKRGIIDLDVVAQLVNEERQKQDLAPLQRSTSLDKSAADMAVKHYWSHYSPDGKAPWQFIQVYTTYHYAGENLALNFSDSDSVVDGWMHSEEHRLNILNPQYQYVGYAVCTAKNINNLASAKIVVQHFIGF